MMEYPKKRDGSDLDKNERASYRVALKYFNKNDHIESLHSRDENIFSGPFH